MKLDITVPVWASHIVSDLTDMDRNPHPVDATKVKKFSLELPEDVYFEYGFVDQDGNIRADPEREGRADNPWYPELSLVTGPDYRPSLYAALDASYDRGDTARHKLESEVLGEARRITVYTPEGYGSESLPTVYFQDGTAYLRVAQVNRVLEKLLEQDKVRPARLVFIEPVDRGFEYSFNPSYREFIKDDLFPFVEKQYAVADERVLWGASLGGLFSTTFALHHPELVTTVVAQSGAFLGTPENKEAYHNDASWVLDTLKDKESLDLRWYLESGTLEWLTEVNRNLKEVLDAKGYEVAYQERNAGHNWGNWRNGLANAMQVALAPA